MSAHLESTRRVVRNELELRIREMQKCLDTAKELLNENDFIQCAVRMSCAADQARFETLLLSVFDSITDKE